LLLGASASQEVPCFHGGYQLTTVCSERHVPLCGDDAQQRWVDDHFAEGIDRGHIERGEAADLAHVHGEVKAVARAALDERAERYGVHRAVDDLV
jgi:hypothetical protein